jgi:hypothetical protein
VIDETFVPPQNAEAEAATLGAILLSPSSLERVVSIVRARDFYFTKNRVLFDCLLFMRCEDQPIDIITVCDRLRERGQFDEIGGASFVAELSRAVPSAANIEYYAGIVAEAARRRDLIRLAQETYDLANDQSREIKEITTNVYQRIIDISSDSGIDAKNAFQWQAESDLDCRPADWLIKGFVERDSLMNDFGDPESGKSFIAIDQACCIASGLWWHGCETKQAPVFVFAGEGRNGIRKRIQAWKLYNNKEAEQLPLYISSKPGAFLDVGTMASIVQASDDLVRVAGRPGLVIIDTVARNFGPGDENSTKDMTAFIATCDLLKTKWHCAVKLIHHTGQTDKTRARGSIALRGALDSEWSVEKDEDRMIRYVCTKMKDHEHPASLAFRFRVLKLGYTEDSGEEATSCVLESTEWSEKPKRGKKNGGRWQSVMMDALVSEITARALQDVGVDIARWKQLCDEQGIPRSCFYDNKRTWESDGTIVIRSGMVLPKELA